MSETQHDPLAIPRPRQNKIRTKGTRAVSEGNYARPQAQIHRPHSTPIEPSTNVFINYIPADFTEDDLRNLCAPYGTIVCCKIMINLETGQSKCFGFVRFAKLEQAQLAIKELQGKNIGSKRLLAKYAQSHEREEHESQIIYIKHLPLDVDVEFVRQVFSRFGFVIQVVPHNINTVEPQYWRAMVQFDSVQAATKAIHDMNNQIIIAGSRPIHVRYADESRLSLPVPMITPRPMISIENKNEHNLLPSFLFL